MARKAQIKKAASDSSEKPTGFLLRKIEDEIEIVEDGLSDVITPSLLRLGSIDNLRGPEAWEKSAEQHRNDPVSIELNRLFSSEFFRLAVALAAFSESRECLERVLKQMIRTFHDIEQITKDFPEAADRIKRAAGELLTAGYEVAKDNVLTAHAKQNATMRPLEQKNAKKADLIDLAQAKAAELWLADTDQEFRLLDMAKQVEDILKREGITDLPAKERIKEWLKPVAPDYARKGGQRRKTP